MTLLQQLLEEKLAEGKSYRRISEKCHVNYVSLSKYHQGKATPEGKNLALLAKFFNVDYWLLLEDAQEHAMNRRQSDHLPPSLDTPDHVLLAADCAKLSGTQLLQARLLIHNLIQESPQEILPPLDTASTK
jgi:transcriptional regulator with XRE-family HTH domain